MDLYSLREALAVVFNLAYVVLAIFENVWCWPTGLLGAALTVLVFFHARLYGGMTLQLIYILLMVYGWYEWRHGGEKGGKLAVSRTPTRWRFLLALAGVVGTVAVGLFLRYRTDAALPFTDAATTCFSLVAQFMTTRKWIGNWLVWIAVNAVYIGMLISQHLDMMAVLYLAYLVLAVLGFWKWQRSLRAEQAGKAV